MLKNAEVEKCLEKTKNADKIYVFLAPRVGFEPTTLRLTAGCSTAELTRNKIRKFSSQIPFLCPLQVLDLAAVFSVSTCTVALPLSYRGIILGNLSSQISALCPLQVLDLAAVFSVETCTVALPLSYRGI